MRTKFGSFANFGNVKLNGIAVFAEALFTGDCWFGEAEFLGPAVFQDARFFGNANFADATFQGRASFTRARFGSRKDPKDVDFTGIKADRSFNLAEAVFSKVPGFNQADFKQTPDLDIVSIPVPDWWRIWRKGDKKQISKYRHIKRLANDRDYSAEHLSLSASYAQNDGPWNQDPGPRSAYYTTCVLIVVARFGDLLFY